MCVWGEAELLLLKINASDDVEYSQINLTQVTTYLLYIRPAVDLNEFPSADSISPGFLGLHCGNAQQHTSESIVQ